jgi:hypothetical protein
VHPLNQDRDEDGNLVRHAVPTTRMQSKALHGLKRRACSPTWSRASPDGYKKTLEIQGVGFKG